MYRNLFVLLVIVGLGLLLLPLLREYEGRSELTPLAAHYAVHGLKEVGATNLVTAVTYRGLDTLGEVTILFLTASIIGFFLKRREGSIKSPNPVPRPSSELLDTSAKILIPLIFLFGIYVFINGHLTPGGGFQGGAIVASGVVLLLMADPMRRFSRKVIDFVESVSGIAFILLGLMGLLFAGGFLDNSFLALGQPGMILSAGAVPLIYIFIGLKVGAELTNIIATIHESQTEEN